MISSLLAVGEIALLAFSWLFAGLLLVPRRIRQEEHPIVVATTAAALGAGATAVILTALVACHRLTRGFIVAVAVAEVVAAVVTARRLRPRMGEPLRRDRPARIALWSLAAIAAITLFATLAPPSSMDAVVYHLRVPKEFLRTGYWTKLDDVHSFQPLYVEMLFGEGIALGGGPLAALVHWALGIAAVGAAAMWGRRIGGPGSGTWAALALGGTALFAWESTSAFIDLGLALFAGLSFYWATRPDAGTPGALLAGAFAGLAGGSKFTGLIVVALTALAAFGMTWPDRRRAVQRSLTIAATALLVASPWYLRNVALTGNPVYPLLNEWFHLPTRKLSGVAYGHGRDLLHLLISPIDLIVRGTAFAEGWSVGPALLVLVPVGIIAFRSRIALVSAGVITIWWLVWFWSSPQTRLLLPIMPMAAGLAGAGFTVLLRSRARALRLFAIGLLGAATVEGLAIAVLYARLNAPVVVGMEAPATFLEQNSWNYVAYEQANRLLPAGSNLAATGIFWNNLYYLDVPITFVGDDEVPLTELRAAGFTHELRITECPLAPTPDRPVVVEGEYPLRASRLRGGVYKQVCYRISSIR